MTFLSDVFHPLVTPLTTYTYSTRDTGAETVSAADKDRLPPGGLSLRHGFPEWFEAARDATHNKDMKGEELGQNEHEAAFEAATKSTATLTVEVLQYLRFVFDTEAILDSVSLETAANPGAWHAWRSYRSKMLGGRASPVPVQSNTPSDTASERSTSPRQQPGGARRPGEWNWRGVWEDRVKKSIQASMSEQILYGGDHSDVVCFSKMDQETVQQMTQSLREPAVT